MNNKHAQLFELIKEFNNLAENSYELFNNKFRLEMSPLEAYKQNLIPKSGDLLSETEIVKYQFHGLGCELEYKSGIVDFNYEKPNWNIEGISVYNLWRYIEDKSLYENINELKKDLNALEDYGKIYKVNPPYLLYNLCPTQE